MVLKSPKYRNIVAPLANVELGVAAKLAFICQGHAAQPASEDRPERSEDGPQLACGAKRRLERVRKVLTARRPPGCPLGRDARSNRRALAYAGAMNAQQAGSWLIHDEQDLGSFGRGNLKRVSVDLPDGVTFDQYVIVLPEAVVVAAVNSEGAVLMLRRHRFILERWVWELPGGYVEEGEDLAAAAARELKEETGWRPGRVEHVVSFQPMVGSADAANHLFVAYDCESTGQEVDINEAGEVRWVGLEEASQMVRDGDLVGAASVIAVSELMARSATQR